MSIPPSEPGPPLVRTPGGVRVAVRVQPRAARDRVQGLSEDEARVKVAVTAAPEDGKANAAVVKLLAGQWRVPKSSVSVVRGAASRDKVLRVAGEPDELVARLASWIETLAHR